jgi:hypothetical protein
VKLRERLDSFPTHKWVARIVFPVVIAQRLTQVIPNDAMDTLMLAYLWWLSEITMQESWEARRLVEDQQD